MTPRTQTIAICAIAALTLVNCSQRKAVQTPSTTAVDAQQLRTEAPLIRIRLQPSTEVFTKRSWWYSQHPKDLAAGLRLCDRAHVQSLVPGSPGKRHYDCRNVVQGQVFVYQMKAELLKIARMKCVVPRYERAFFSECQAAKLAEEHNTFSPSSGSVP